MLSWINGLDEENVSPENLYWIMNNTAKPTAMKHATKTAAIITWAMILLAFRLSLFLTKLSHFMYLNVSAEKTTCGTSLRNPPVATAAAIGVNLI